jgi:hypothetical protein
MSSTQAASIIKTDESVAECKKILKAHGFLIRAQFQCGFRYYSNEMIASAAACAKKINDAEVKQVTLAGMENFDEHEKERGHKVVCAAVLKDFPKIVRR